MKRVFVIDWILIVVFIVSAISGIGLHIAGHGNSHEVWHNWAVVHVLGSISFLVAIIFHVTTHWGWYKGIIKNGIGRKSKVTAVLSIIFLLLSIKNGIGRKSKVTAVLSIIFLLLSVTGIVLLGVSGANSPLGLWHYKIGIITTVIAVGHIIKRLPVLYKSMDRKGRRTIRPSLEKDYISG